MRKVGIILIAVVVVLIGLAVIVPYFMDVNRYRGKIQTELEQRLNRPVSLGEMRASLLPPSFKVQNAVIGEDRRFQTGRPFGSAELLTVSVQLMPLLGGNIEIDSIELKRPQVELVRDQQGVWNFASLGNRTVTGATTPAQPQEKAASQQSFSLGELKLTDGTVAITDLQKHQSRAVYDHIDLLLEDFAPAKPFKVTLAAHLPGEGAQVVKLEGRGGPIDDASMINTPFDGTLKLDEVALSGVQKFLNSPALTDMNATVSGEASLKNQSGKMASKGSLKIEKAVVKRHEIGYPITVDYDVADDLNTDIIQIGHANLKLGNTPLAVAGSVNTKNTPALLDVKLNANDVSIAEVARLAAAFGYAFNPNMQATGRLNADLHVQGSAESPVLNGTIAGRDLNISGKDLPQPVRVSQIQLAMSPDAIRSGNFTASTGGTNVTGRFELRQYSSKSPVANATLQIPETELSEVMNIARSFSPESMEGVSGSGRFALNVTVNGPIKNTNAMTFSGNGSLRNASIRSPKMTQPLNVTNAAMNFTQNGVELENFTGSVGSTHANGRISVRNFDTPQIALALNADVIDALEWQKLIAPTPEQQKKNEPSILDKASGGGPLTIGTLRYDQLQFNNVRTTLALDHGVIRLAPVAASVAAGLSNGTITVDTRGPQTQIAVNMAVQKVDANKLLSSVSKVKDTLFGLLASNLQGQFHTVNSGQDIASTLNGKVSLNLTDGKLANVDFLQQLSQVAGFQSLGRAATGATELRKVVGNFNIQNGVASTTDLRADLGVGNLAASGLMSLVDNTVNMKVTAVLNKDYSQQVGGNNIGGFMQTALANNRGELVLPVLVTGTLQNPKVAPDLQTIAQMKLQNVVPTLQNPGALGGIVSGILGGKGQQQQGGASQSENPIGGIIGALGGKKTQQQQPQGNQPNNNAQQQQQQQQPTDAINDALGQLLGGKKKKQQPPPPPPQQQAPPPQ